MGEQDRFTPEEFVFPGNDAGGEGAGRSSNKPTQPAQSQAEVGSDMAQQGVYQPEELPLLGLHVALEQAGAYEKIKKPKNRQVLQTYLTTDKSMGDLRELAGVKDPQSVYSIIHRNLREVFEYLPQDVQEEYENHKAAIRRKSGRQLQTKTSRERIAAGLREKNLRHSEQGLENIRQARRNIPREHYSNAANRRWELYRERKAQSQSASQPETHTLIDFTQPPQKSPSGQ